SNFFWGAGIVTGPFFRCPLGRISKARAGRSKNPPNFLSESISTATVGSESIALSQNMCFLTGGKGFWFSVTAFSESAQEFRGRAPNFKMRPGDQGRKSPVVGHQRPTTGFTFEICWTCDPRKRGRSCPRFLNHVPHGTDRGFSSRYPRRFAFASILQVALHGHWSSRK